MPTSRIRLDDPRNYFNRHESWLAFNRRVLEEAQDEGNPLLERVKFLAITASNLDEFIEVRVAGLLQQAEHGKARRAKLEAGQAEGGVDLGSRLRVTRQSSGTPPQLRTTSLNLQHVGRADMLKWFCASQDTISTGGDDHVSPTKRCIHAALVQRSLE